MAALSADERHRKQRRRSLLKGVCLGALAVGVPALLLRRSRSAVGAPQRHDWGQSRRYAWREHRVHFQHLGSGPPVVLLHSLGPGHDAQEWRAVAQALAARHEVFVPDLPGWGRSAEQPFRPSASDYAAFVSDFSEGVVREPAVIVAAHRSAAFSVAAIAAGLQARGLALVTPRGLPSDETVRSPIDRVLRTFVKAPVFGPSTIETYVTRAALLRHLQTDVYAAPERVDAALVERHYVASHQPGSTNALEALLSGDLDLDVQSVLPALGLPLWLAWGRDAASPPVEAADRWLMHLPTADLAVFDGCGLLPHAEAPQSFARHLTDFIDSLDQPESRAQ